MVKKFLAGYCVAHKDEVIIWISYALSFSGINWAEKKNHICDEYYKCRCHSNQLSVSNCTTGREQRTAFNFPPAKWIWHTELCILTWVTDAVVLHCKSRLHREATLIIHRISKAWFPRSPLMSDLVHYRLSWDARSRCFLVRNSMKHRRVFTFFRILRFAECFSPLFCPALLFTVCMDAVINAQMTHGSGSGSASTLFHYEWHY